MASKPAPKTAPLTKTTKATKPAAPKKAAGVGASEKGKPGRRPLPNAAEIKRDLCAWLEQGKTLAAFLRETPNAPGRVTITDWLAADSEFAEQYARAREIGYDAIAEELLTITDEEPERDPQGKIDAGSVAHQRLRADTRRWLLSKWQPKRYGDKLDTTVSAPGGGPAQFSLTVGYMHAPKRSEDDDGS